MLSQCKDIGQVATVSGSSPWIIKKNYLELVKPSAVDACFKIVPSTTNGKIIKISWAF
jgi:hypothetical protein